MGFFDFVKSAGQAVGIGSDKETEAELDARAAKAKAASQAARAEAQAEKAAEVAEKEKAEEEAKLSVATFEDKIKASKIEVKDLSLRIDGEDQVKVYGVVESAEEKADLVLLVGNTPGVARVEDAIKVRKPGSDKDEENLPEPRFHQVKSGETLGSIAQQELGDSSRYMEIFNANRNILHNPDEIDIGQTLRIPTE